MKDISFAYKRDILLEGFDGRICRIAPHAFRTPDGRMHITYNTLLLTGIDVFMGHFVISSGDGVHFSAPVPFDPIPDTVENGVRTVYALTPYYHRHSDTNYCLGRITRYRDNDRPITDQKDMMPALTGRFDPENLRFIDCVRLDSAPFADFDCVSFMEPIEEKNGDILAPAYVRKAGDVRSKIVVVRFSLVDGRLVYREHGNLLARDELARGIGEPRIASLNGRTYMTIRSDESCYLAVSEDGLHYAEPEQWLWDDGEPLTSRNTQQAWVTHRDGLFLVYTRETPHNRHIFRRRAPLFMARFNEDTKRLMKDSEVILVPEMGARLGNFSVTEISDTESWVSVCEWMQTTEPHPYDWHVCESYGARNRLWRTRILFGV